MSTIVTPCGQVQAANFIEHIAFIEDQRFVADVVCLLDEFIQGDPVAVKDLAADLQNTVFRTTADYERAFREFRDRVSRSKGGR